VTLCKPFI